MENEVFFIKINVSETTQIAFTAGSYVLLVPAAQGREGSDLDSGSVCGNEVGRSGVPCLQQKLWSAVREQVRQPGTGCLHSLVNFQEEQCSTLVKNKKRQGTTNYVG